MKKLIGEGEQIPRGYGVAWLELDRFVAVCYPIPLNIIFAHIRKIYMCLQQGDWYKTGYDRGYFKGKEEGRKYAFNQLKTQIIKQEVDRLLRRGFDAMDEMVKMNREGKDVNGYFLKIIEEETKRIDNSL